MAAAVLVAGGLAVYYGAIRDDGGSEAEPAATTDAASQIREARAGLTEGFNDKRLGIRARFPASWKAGKGPSKHLLESGDRCMAITLAAPAPADDAGRMRRDALSLLKGSFKQIQVQPGEKGKQIGGIPTQNDVITVRGKGMEAIRVLLGVGKGKQLAYLSEVVLRDQSCSEALLEGQMVLSSVRFSR